MTKRFGNQAYTITEVMIVLAVTAAMLLSALLVISGRQERVEFTESVNEIRKQIDDTINTIASGNYPSFNNFVCDDNGSGEPHITAGANQQGTNRGCIYVGRAMQFAPNSDRNAYNIYSLAGLQYANITTGRLATTLAQVSPVALTPTTTHPLPMDNAERRFLQYSIAIRSMTYEVGGVDTDTSTFVIMPTFGQYSGNNLAPGSQQLNLYAVTGTSVNTAAGEETSVDGIYKGTNLVAAEAISICMDGGGNEHAVIVIGRNNRQLSTIIERANGSCP